MEEERLEINDSVDSDKDEDQDTDDEIDFHIVTAIY